MHAPVPEVECHAPSRSCLRIAVVTETWPPEVNGVAVALAQLVTALRRLGHEIQLVRPRQTPGDAVVGPQEGEVLTSGMPIPRYPHLRMGLPCRRRLARVWTQHRPDIVHVATEGPLGWSALQAARALRLPITSDFRTNFHAYSTHYGVGWLREPILGYLRQFHNGCGRTMVPTEALRAELEGCGLHRLAVVARGVDTERFDPRRRSVAMRHAWGVGDDSQPVVLYVGRLAAEKNLGVLASAFAAVQAAVPDARFVVVGDGPARDALQAACPAAHFAGQRHGTDLATCYASADVMLFPSCTETFGNVTVEAMASGLPVVAFDHAAAGQLIRSGHNGMLAPWADVGAFTRAAIELTADAARRRRLGRAARDTVMPLAWSAIAMRVEAILRQVISEHAEAAASSLPVGEHAVV